MKPSPLGGDALGAIADVEGDGPQPAPRGEGAKAQQELAQDRAATADRDDRKASARVPRAADDRGRAKRIAGHEHPTPFCRGADVSDGEVTPLPARADLDERSQGLSHRLRIDARRLPRDRARQSRCFMTPQVGGATEPKAPRGPPDTSFVAGPRATDDQLHAVILPDRLPGGSRQRGFKYRPSGSSGLIESPRV